MKINKLKVKIADVILNGWDMVLDSKDGSAKPVKETCYSGMNVGGKHMINRGINGQLPTEIIKNIDHAYINEGNGSNYRPRMLMNKAKKGNKGKAAKSLYNIGRVGYVPNRFEVLRTKKFVLHKGEVVHQQANRAKNPYAKKKALTRSMLLHHCALLEALTTV